MSVAPDDPLRGELTDACQEPGASRGAPVRADTAGVTRRTALRSAVGGIAALGVGGALQGCGSTSPAPAAATGPRTGGTLIMACVGGGSTDTLDAHNALDNVDFARAPQLYETLLEFDPNTLPVVGSGLAEEILPNADATHWTIRLRKGVEFHNGKEMTADDVVFTFQRIIKGNHEGATLLAPVDIGNVRSVDRYTVAVPMHMPYSNFTITQTFPGVMSIVPVGYNPKAPVGTGAFKYQSFTPGVKSTFVRNPNYWRSGEPHLDSVVISDYTDETAQISALQAGQVTCIDNLSVEGVRALSGTSGVKVDTWPGIGWIPFTMRVDSAPFSDVSLRQAIRLMIDRPAMLQQVFGGHGRVGNDIFGISDPLYPRSIPQRHQDLEQAKFLLRKAGLANSSVTLITSDIRTGALEMAQVIKQQASGAGLTINLSQKTVDAYNAGYLRWPFSQDWYDGSNYLLQTPYSMLPSSPYNETHWQKSPYAGRYYRLYDEAMRTTSSDRQAEIIAEMAHIDYNYGGYIIPIFSPVLAAQSDKLAGVKEQTGTAAPWVNYLFRTLWLES